MRCERDVFVLTSLISLRIPRTLRPRTAHIIYSLSYYIMFTFQVNFTGIGAVILLPQYNFCKLNVIGKRIL